jgi:hypothetical protein
MCEAIENPCDESATASDCESVLNEIETVEFVLSFKNGVKFCNVRIE